MERRKNVLLSISAVMAAAVLGLYSCDQFPTDTASNQPFCEYTGEPVPSRTFAVDTLAYSDSTLETVLVIIPAGQTCDALPYAPVHNGDPEADLVLFRRGDEQIIAFVHRQ